MTRPSGPGDVAVVVPVYNKAALAAECARALLAAVAVAHARGFAIDLVFVDHCSTDGAEARVADEIARSGQPARVLRQVGGTVSAVRNTGARATTAPLLCFVDSDCVVPGSFLVDVIEVGRETDAGAFGCQYDPPTGGHWSEYAWDDLHNPRSDGDRGFLNGGDLIVRRAVFDAVGGWDERLSAGEDSELCLRIRAAGHRVYESRRLAVLHLGNPKSVGEFYRKQRWHGSGTLDSRELRWARMSLMVYAFILTWVAAPLVLLAAPGPLRWRVPAALALLAAVPAAAVLIRAVAIRRFGALPQGFVLYTVYLAARAVEMFASIRRRLAAPRLARGTSA